MATIYIHWPFCISKCAYCDFNSFTEKSLAVRSDADFRNWLNLYKNALLKFDKIEKITSIYFGGGTPSLLPSFFVEELLQFIFDTFNIVNNAEITLEANPGTISFTKALSFYKAGVNRLSIGVQSIYDKGLKILGRDSHSASQAIECVREMSNIFNNISIDLIYNRPFQKSREWEKELSEAVNLLGEYITHISCYELIIEEGTLLHKQVLYGIFPKPALSRAFDITYNVLTKNGFEMYEVSNYARPGYEGRHNMSYWKYENYYGIGPGAHSRIMQNGRKIALEQEKNPQKWFKTQSFYRELLSESDILKEKLIMGLRAKCGIRLEDLANISNINKKLKALSDNLYIICHDERVIMTYEGLKKLNLIIRYILGE